VPRSRPFAADDPTPTSADGGDFALPGAVGQSVTRLLGEALADGRATLESLLRSAVTRRLEAGLLQAGTSHPLFTAAERETLQDAFTLTTTAADLLGRLRVHRTAQAIRERGREAFAADPLRDLARLPRSATEALRYFLDLAPMLGLDPIREGPFYERHAFTLAAATEETLLGKVQKALGDFLPTNWNSPQSSDKPRGPEVVQAVLDQCGVTPRNPQYAEMVFRTNVIDSFNSGLTRQMSTPEMQKDFPAWEYLGIDDGRAGDDHRVHFGKLYPSSVPFAAVRGPRVFNCRCTARPVHVLELDELRAKGVRVESK
jgi:hypothetical protein